MEEFNANCSNADNCLNFLCSRYTPKKVTVETIEPAKFCDKNPEKRPKFVHVEPWTSEDWDILQSQYMRCNAGNERVAQEGV